MVNKGKIRFYHGRSMRGIFRPGDCLFPKPVTVIDLQPGDIIIFRGLNRLGEEDDIVHRVVVTSPGEVVTCGDNNPRNDSDPVTDENLIGKITYLERNGRTRRVYGGRLGLMQSRFYFFCQRAWRLFRRWVGKMVGWAYRGLRKAGLVSCVWHPPIYKVHLITDNGTLVKYVHKGRTVASWWPGEDRFECMKPFDLVIHPDGLWGKFKSPRGSST